MNKTTSRTSGHYDEITKIHQFRSGQYGSLTPRLEEQREQQRAVRNKTYATTGTTLSRTTTRKAPAGHH